MFPHVCFFPGNQSCRFSSQFLLPAVGSGELGSACRGPPALPALPPPRHAELRRHPAGELSLRLKTTAFSTRLSRLLSFLLQTDLKSFRCSFVATVIHKRLTQVRLALFRKTYSTPRLVKLSANLRTNKAIRLTSGNRWYHHVPRLSAHGPAGLF